MGSVFFSDQFQNNTPKPEKNVGFNLNEKIHQPQLMDFLYIISSLSVKTDC